MRCRTGRLCEMPLGTVSTPSTCRVQIRLLASLRHSNIIRYREAFSHGDSICIVMEHAPCGDLQVGRWQCLSGSRCSAVRHISERLSTKFCAGASGESEKDQHPFHDAPNLVLPGADMQRPELAALSRALPNHPPRPQAGQHLHDGERQNQGPGSFFLLDTELQLLMVLACHSHCGAFGCTTAACHPCWHACLPGRSAEKVLCRWVTWG